MKSTSITTLAALLIIGAGAFMAGRISSSTDSADQAGRTKETRFSSRSSSADLDGNSANPNKKIPRSERGTKAASESTASRLSRMESIIRGEDSLERTRALLEFIDQMGPADFEAAIANFRGLGITEDRFGEYGMLLSAWAKVDPMAALAYAKANTRSPFATNTILATWATIDPESAISWAQANHSGDAANPYLAGIIRSLATTDPTRATQLLTGMPRSQERGEALDAMLPHLVKLGADAARSWIAGLSDEALRNGAIGRIAGRLAETDPSGTAAWLLANPGEGTQRSIDDVFGTWATQDPQAALSSLNTIPAGEMRSNALRGMIASTAMNNPRDAVAMMNRFPADVNDRVVKNFVWHSFGNNPSLAMDQIARMTDEEERNRTYSRAVGSWLERDPPAATTWIQANPLPPAVQERMEREKNR